MFKTKNFTCLELSRKCVSLFSYQGSLLLSFATARIFYHTVLSLSRTFFIFLKFLSSRESVLSCSNCYILPQLLQLVNNFFCLFYFFLISLLPRDQCLPILSSCSAFVNGVFHIFSIFFCTLFFPLFNPQIRTFSFHDFLNPERILPSFLPAGKLSSS